MVLLNIHGNGDILVSIQQFGGQLINSNSPISASHHGIHQNPGYESYVYHSGPTKVSYSVPGAGYEYGIYGNKQVIHGQGHGQSQGVVPVADAGHPGQVSEIYKTYAGWAGQNVRRKQPVSSVHTGSSVVSSSNTAGYERPSSVHPDYAPYVHTQYVHKIPYRIGYHQQSIYYPQQSPYYGFPVQVPVR